MPRTSEANAIIKDERRQEILLAALKLFSTNGFESTKIGDIAKEAKISHGLIYHYFTSKEEVHTELVKQATASTIDLIQTAASLPFSAAEKISTITGELLARLNAPGQEQYSCLLMLDAIRSSDATASIPSVLMQYLITEGQQDGDIVDGEPQMLANLIFAMLLGLALYKTKMDGFVLPEAQEVFRLIQK